MKLAIELPEELCDAIRLPEGERKERLLLELAIGLYTGIRVSLHILTLGCDGSLSHLRG